MMFQLASDLPLRTLRLTDHVARAHAAAWVLENCGDPPSKAVILDTIPEAGTWNISCAPCLWFGQPAEGSLAYLLSMLTETDRREISMLRDHRDRWSVAAARGMVRIMLSHCLGCTAQEVAIVREERGKPVLDPARHGAIAHSLHFSISHSRELVGVAVARSRIGIDVEAIRPLPELMQIASTVLAPEMLDVLGECENELERASLFYRFWTLGEAFTKANGTGLGQGLQSFAFSAREEPVLKRVSASLGPHHRWCFGALTFGETCVEPAEGPAGG
jgi:4'-phosphopantetheinyl transferase